MTKTNLIIIGSGPGGYRAAHYAAQHGLTVTIIEAAEAGGTCLNRGCIPTKTLCRNAEVVDTMQHTDVFGVALDGFQLQFPKVIERKQQVVEQLRSGIETLMQTPGITFVRGFAHFKDSKTVVVGEEEYTADNIMIATGSDSKCPPIEGTTLPGVITSTELLDIDHIPERLCIIGAGVIGMEFASFFNSLGVQVTVVEMLDEILGGMDKELSAMLRAEYAKKGIKFLLSTKVVEVSKGETGITVSYENADGAGTVTADKLLMSVGRRPVTKGFGLENLNLEWTERRCIKVDEHLQSSVPGVYVCGDLNGVSLLAHTAVREAEVAVHHITGKEDAMSYRAIPGVVYTNPEIAGVGMSEEALQAAGIPYRAVKLPMAYSGRFVAENEGVNGVCKVLTAEDGTVLGAHMLGNPASELIVLAGMAIEDGKTIEDWKRYVFPHPTVGEIFREL